MTEEMLTGEEQTVEFQEGDESGKLIGVLAASALGGVASGVAGKKCSVM